MDADESGICQEVYSCDYGDAENMGHRVLGLVFVVCFTGQVVGLVVLQVVRKSSP